MISGAPSISTIRISADTIYLHHHVDISWTNPHVLQPSSANCLTKSEQLGYKWDFLPWNTPDGSALVMGTVLKTVIARAQGLELMVSADIC